MTVEQFILFTDNWTVPEIKSEIIATNKSYNDKGEKNVNFAFEKNWIF